MSATIVHSSELASRRRFLSTLASLGAVGAVSNGLGPLGKIALAACTLCLGPGKLGEISCHFLRFAILR